ncbi:type II toxin-antitoxin system VapC family toxin [Patescibacteria group bacterium]|nr:type II toxin-antitoxin system VapC family toxin [Patescibacteria group bacterium]
MKKVLLDTDVLIDELRQPEKETIYKTLKAQKYKLYVCAITVTELWAGESITKPKGKRLVSKILKEVSIVPLSNQILRRAGEKLRKNKNLYLADAMVAATALIKKLPLVTLNIRHFQHIKGLKLYTP